MFFGFLVDEQYNQVRKKPLFSLSALLVYGLAIALPFIGLVGFFAPVKFGGMFFMKWLALGTALAMLVFDILMLIAVRKECDKLKKEFTRVIIMIDLPVFLSICLTLKLAHYYLSSLLPNFVGPSLSNAVFVHGLTAGAVAVEIWFANFLFLYLLHESIGSNAELNEASVVPTT